MRVVHLVSSGESGGTEASLIEMIASLGAARPTWTLGVVTPQDGALAARLRTLGVPVEVVPFPAAVQRLGEAGRADTLAGRARVVLDLLRAAPAVARYRRRIRARLVSGGTRVDVLHAHGFKMQVVGALARPRGMRLIWHMHDYVGSRFASARLLGALGHRCSAVIANSQSVAADVHRTCPSARVVTVYNAVDTQRFCPDGPALDLDALGHAGPAGPRAVRVGLVAAFGRWKGHFTVLRALARLGPAPVRVYMIGSAQYHSPESQYPEAALREAARELGVGDRVVFTGAVDDVPAALRALDIVVHASTEPEPFGMVIAEAMACGRAVVFARAGGAAELVTDGVDALGHRPGDDEDLARAIGRLAGDSALRARLGAAARASAVARFDRARLAREIAPLYGG